MQQPLLGFFGDVTDGEEGGGGGGGESESGPLVTLVIL